MPALLQWMEAHQTWLWWAGALSGVVVLGSLVVVPLLVVQIPADYFAAANRRDRRKRSRHPVMRWIVLGVKNVTGGLLLLAGLVMLVLPGQGLLTLFIGMSLIDFPGKFRLERRVVRIPAIHRSMNWVRARYDHPPLQLDPAPPST